VHPRFGQYPLGTGVLDLQWTEIEAKYVKGIQKGQILLTLPRDSLVTEG
jgi:hypothetical protein